MYRKPVVACTSPGPRGPIRDETEMSMRPKQNLATTPPGLLQGELQGCSPGRLGGSEIGLDRAGTGAGPGSEGVKQARGGSRVSC